MLRYMVDAENFRLERLRQDDYKLSIILIILLNRYSDKLLLSLETPSLLIIYFLRYSYLKVAYSVAMEKIGPVLAISCPSVKMLSLTWFELIFVTDRAF